MRWIPINHAWPLLGRKALLVTDGDLTVRAWTVRKPSRVFPYGIVIPEDCHTYFKSDYITHWIYIKNMNHADYFAFFPRGNHDDRTKKKSQPRFRKKGRFARNPDREPYFIKKGRKIVQESSQGLV